MKIYFAGAIRAGREDAAVYHELVAMLSKYGTVLTEHVGNVALSEKGELETEERIFERDRRFLAETDVLVAEVSTPSLGVGYEIAIAENLGKKILCLYQPRNGKFLSAMIVGNKRITLESYFSPEGLPPILEKFFNNIK